MPTISTDELMGQNLPSPSSKRLISTEELFGKQPNEITTKPQDIPEQKVETAIAPVIAPEATIGGIPKWLPGGGYGSVPESEYRTGRMNLLGNFSERPAAMARESIRENPLRALLGPPLAGLLANKGGRAEKAAVNPSISPTFQQEALDKLVPPTGSGMTGPIGVAANTLMNIPASTFGAAADFVANPGQALLTLLGIKAPETKVGQTIGKTPIEDIPSNIVKEIRTIPKNVGTKFNEVTGRGIEPLQNVIEKTIENASQAEEGLKIGIDKEKSIQNILKTEAQSKLDNLKINKQVALEQAEKEAKDKFPELRKSLSDWYGKHYDNIINNAINSGKIKMTTADAQAIVDKIREDLDTQGITSGKGYKQFETFEKKYGVGGLNEEINPEAAQMAKAMGYKNIKGLKSSGINWDRVNLEQSSAGVVRPTTNISLADFVRDTKQITGDFSEGSRVGGIAHKYISQWMSKNLPTMAKLNELAGPLLEAKNFASDVIKPGNIYKGKFAELIDRAVSSPTNINIPEKDLLAILEKGRYGIKGIGNVSKNVRTIQDTINELQNSTSQAMGKSITKESKLSEALNNERMSTHATKTELGKMLSEAQKKKIIISPKQLLQYFQKKGAYRVFSGIGGR